MRVLVLLSSTKATPIGVETCLETEQSRVGCTTSLAFRSIEFLCQRGLLSIYAVVISLKQGSAGVKAIPDCSNIHASIISCHFLSRSSGRRR